MNVLDMARKAAAAAAEARELWDAVGDAVKDGRKALSATEQTELDKLLDEEALETRRASDKFEAALDAADRG